MGNNPSTSKSDKSSASSSPSGHDATHRAPSTRRGDPRNLIHAQRTAGPAVTAATVSHRTRNSQSTPVAHLNQPSPSHSVSTSSPQGSESHVAAPSPPKQESKTQAVDIPSKPVDVPLPTSIEISTSNQYSTSIEPSGPPPLTSIPGDMSYHAVSRPPRLPLPIEEEVHTPGSPIIAPTDIEGPVLDLEALDSEGLPRRSSNISNTTADEENEEDAEELRVDKTKATVPTTFEWQQGGEKVYVTGTIFQWNKKHRLHPVEGQPGLLRATIYVRPGTHHIRFIADNVMQCSTHLPTTVDFGNNLVNYIEVSADDLPQPTAEAPSDAPATDDTGKKPEPVSQTPQTAEQEKAEGEKVALKTKPALPAARWTNQVPQYLSDLDKPEGSESYENAAAAIEKLPAPPSLPGFLGKPILNAATPMKDDNSVLTMPNHTVLNHLATSSIKDGVLAVSATTRYRKKYVTTIMYKPSGDD